MRKEKVIKLNDRGRELTFKIREMPASQLERWLMRALLLVSKGANTETGLDALRALNADGTVRALAAVCGAVSYDDAQPLLDEMLACCSRVDAGIEQVCTPETVDGYIEDVRTLFRLRVETVRLHFDFFIAESPSPSQAEGAPVKPTRPRSPVIKTLER